jgi:hypothetical protein
MENHLFDLLKRGYIDARYKDDYIISGVELQALIDKVDRMKELVEKNMQKEDRIVGIMCAGVMFRTGIFSTGNSSFNQQISHLNDTFSNFFRGQKFLLTVSGTHSNLHTSRHRDLNANGTVGILLCSC